MPDHLHRSHDHHQPGHQHNECLETLRKVEAALDGELSAEQERELWDHLQQCNGCLDRYQIERDFKTFLTSKMEHKQLSDSFIRSLRAQIFSARNNES
jgi:anti-sigma factor (TIGR02949 family)